MTVELAIVISGLSLAFAVYFGVSNQKRNTRADASKEASDFTTVIVKLEVIASSVNEIKTDMKSTNSDVKELSMEITKLKQQVRALEKTVFNGTKSIPESVN